jgi:uncharacterized protein YdeI (BOF family)
MKKIITIAAFALISLSAAAQQKSKSDSKWTSTTDGQTYQMEASSTSNAKSTEKSHVSFSINGDAKYLSKVIFTKKDELFVNIGTTKETQEINVEPGLYKFKFYHDKIGVQEFEVDLKNGDNKTVTLTLK